MKNLSVIIATRNSPTIDLCLSVLCMQGVEVIVFLNGSEDKDNLAHYEKLKKYPIKIIKINWFNYSRIANEGVKVASNDKVAILDDDMVVSEKWAERIIEYLDHVDILHGPIWYVPGNNRIALYFSKMWNRDMNTKEHLIDPNLAFKKSILSTIGDFDEDINAYTWDLYQRTKNLGVKISRYSDIPVIHLQVNSFRRLTRTYYNYGKYQKQFFRKYRAVQRQLSAIKNIFLFVPFVIADGVRYRDFRFALFFRTLRLYKALGFILN